MPTPEPTDPGLARERTDLSWNRTGLAAMVCVAVLLRRLWPLHGTGAVVALTCIALGAGAWGLAMTVGPTLSTRAGANRPVLSTRRATAITAGTLALAVAGFVLGFFQPS